MNAVRLNAVRLEVNITNVTFKLTLLVVVDGRVGGTGGNDGGAGGPGCPEAPCRGGGSGGGISSCVGCSALVVSTGRAIESLLRAGRGGGALPAAEEGRGGRGGGVVMMVDNGRFGAY